MTISGSDARPAPSSAAQRRPQRGWHPVEWACELAGTFLLVFVGLSAVVFDFGTGSPLARVVASPSARLLITGAVFAASGSLVAISPLGRRSGAHLNPAVTLAFYCNRHVSRDDLPGYVIAQCLGAVAGGQLLHLVWGARAASVDDGTTRPGHGLGSLGAAGVEALMTAALVLSIFGLVSSRRTARWTPLGVWVLVTILVWRVAPYTGTSLNPARSLGPAVVAGDFADYWVYVLGPVAGALFAVLAWTLVPRATLTAKLFHDDRYSSVLRSELPVRHREDPR